MIYKKQGNVKIHRLKVIHIYEVDYNFLVRVVRREAIQHVQQLGKIKQGQYGGWPGRDYTSGTYLEEKRRDTSILTQTAYANFYNDAASFNDQRLMSVASISGRKYGVKTDSICTRSDSGRNGIQTETIIKNFKHIILTL